MIGTGTGLVCGTGTGMASGTASGAAGPATGTGLNLELDLYIGSVFAFSRGWNTTSLFTSGGSSSPPASLHTSQVYSPPPKNFRGLLRLSLKCPENPFQHGPKSFWVLHARILDFSKVLRPFTNGAPQPPHHAPHPDFRARSGVHKGILKNEPCNKKPFGGNSTPS